MKKTGLSISLILLFSLISQGNLYSRDEPEGIPGALKEELLSIAKNFAFLYPALESRLILHELGHALVNKALTGDLIDIHIGAEPPKTKVPEKRKRAITFHGLNPFDGYSNARKLPKDKIGKFLICTAGGVFGAASDYLFLSLLAFYHKYRECKNIKKSIIYGIKNALLPFKNIKLNKNLNKLELINHVICVSFFLMFAVRQLFYAFLPGNCDLEQLYPHVSQGTDGTKAWKSLKASNKTNKVVNVFGWVAEWAIRIFIIKQAIKCVKEYERES